MRLWLVLPVALAGSPAHSQAVQLLEPHVFGRSTTEAVTLLRGKVADEAEPYLIQLDVRCGVYYAASVFYSAPATHESVRSSLNQLYGAFETEHSTETLGLWRVENWRTGGRKPQYGSPPAEDSLLAIELSRDDKGVRIIYIEGHLRLAECQAPAANRR